MNTKLPKVYAGPISDKLNVNQEVATLDTDNNISLDTILNDTNKYLFNHKYKIILNNGKIYESSIISKKGLKIITIDNDLIDISDIKNIYEIKK